MGDISRRDLLKLGAGATVASGATLAACSGGGLHESTTAPDEPAAATPTPQPQTKTATVHVVQGRDLYAMTSQAVQALGGMSNFVKAGDRVFIKPNFVTIASGAQKNTFTNGECTKVEVVTTVAEEALKAGASEVMIGDGAQAMTFSWEFAKTLDGTKTLPAEAKRLSDQYGKPVNLVCLAGESEFVEIPSKTGFGKLKVSSLVVNADKVISLPVLKTHTYCVMTLALKCFVGTISLAGYNTQTPNVRSDLHLTTGGIEQCFLDVVAHVKPVMGIIDCSIGCEGDGPGVAPTAGITVDMKDRAGSWRLLASTDLLALDTTALRMTSHNPDNVRFVALAKQMGLGVADESGIEVKGASLAQIKVPWKQAVSKNPEALLPTPTPGAWHPGHAGLSGLYA